jgi:hypothetical protein
MAQFHLPHMPHWAMWDTFTHSHMSVLKLFLRYTVPMSILPPAMIYYAGVTYGGEMLPALSATQLVSIGILFYIVELAMTFAVAYVIQQLGEWVQIKPAFEDSYKLAVVVPTPLWLAPLFLFIPSFMLNLTAGAAALILSGMLIYYSVPPILKVEEKGHAILLSGCILAAGMVAWALMMYLTLLFWSVGTTF